MNVTFDESQPLPKYKELVDDDLVIKNILRNMEETNINYDPPPTSENHLENSNPQTENLPKEPLIIRNHPTKNIIGNKNHGILTRSQAHNLAGHLAFFSKIEPKNINDALMDEDWILAMQEKLEQFSRNKVWELILILENISIIGTKWVFRNKLNESETVVRNKNRFVAQRYTQQEGIDFDKTYALVVRIESIHMLLAYACHKGFKLFQIDVKSEFLNGYIKEEVYVKHMLEDFEHLDYVYKLHKALYGLNRPLELGMIV